LELDEVGINQILCDYENFNNKPMAYSAVSFMPSETIHLSYLDLKTTLVDHPDVMYNLKLKSLPFPNDIKIRK